MYLCVVMTMTSLSVIFAVLVTNLHSRGSKLQPSPHWLSDLCVHRLAGWMGVSQNVPLLASTIYLVSAPTFIHLSCVVDPSYIRE